MVNNSFGLGYYKNRRTLQIQMHIYNRTLQYTLKVTQFMKSEYPQYSILKCLIE